MTLLCLVVTAFGTGISRVAFAAAPDECPKGMSQLDCDSLHGDWVNWVPDNGCGDGSGGTTTLVGSDPLQQAYNYFVSKGLSNVQAAAVVGNLDDESSLDPTVMEIGGHSNNPADAGSKGWGIAQWSPGIKVIGEAQKYNVTGDITKLATQLDIVWAEMNNTSPVGYQHLTNGLKQINDLSTAVSFFQHNFEGGIDGVRQQDAQQVLKLYGGGGSSSGGNTSVSGQDCSFVASGNCSVTQPVYSGQYSQSQLAAIFGNPGTAASHPDLHLVTVKFLGFNAQVNPKVAPCLEAVSQQLTQENETYKVTQFGCYRFDSNNGSSNIGLSSYHTYGAACDINWDTNPFEASGANVPHDMPQQFVDAFHAHGFTWGGSWTQPKDFMHFEWHGVMPPS